MSDIKDKSCFDCKSYCDNGWKVVCLNEKNEEGICAIEEAYKPDYCELWEDDKK